jgi:hypothetical protein
MTTNIVTTVSGNGYCGYDGDYIQATSASISNALSLTIDAFGNVYIADTYNNRIRKVDSDSGFYFFIFNNMNIFIINCNHQSLKILYNVLKKV